jgi:hypothetical protein
MTPSTWTVDTLVAYGALWMFGGVFVAVGVGALVGRHNPTLGAGIGLLTWGAGNLLVSVLLALMTYVDATVLTLPLQSCEADPAPGPARAASASPPAAAATPAATAPASYQPVFRLQTAGRPDRVVLGPKLDRPCPGRPGERVELRIRQDAMETQNQRLVGAWADDDKPVAIMTIWGVFGGAGLLFGGLLAGHQRLAKSSAKVQQRAHEAVIAPWRKTIGALLGQLGLWLFLGAFVAPFFLDGGTDRAVQFGLRAASAAMACWLLAAGVAGTLTVAATGALILLAGGLLGMAELTRLGF